MKIRGRVVQVTVKEDKDHDIRFSLSLDDDDLVQLLRYLRGRTSLMLHIEPRVYQQEMLDESVDEEPILLRDVR